MSTNRWGALLLIGMLAWPCLADISANKVLSSLDETDAASYTSASMTIPPYAVVYAGFYSADTGDPPTPTMTWTGSRGPRVLWYLWATKGSDSGASPTHRTTVFRCGTTSSVAGTATWDLGGNTQARGGWWVYYVLGADYNDNGLLATRNIASNHKDSGTSLTVTLSAFAAASSGAFLTGWNDTTATLNPEAGWTELEDVGPSFSRMGLMFTAANDTTASLTTGSSCATGSIAWEVVDGGPPTPRVILNGFAGNNASSYTSASFTPAADTPHLLVVANVSNAATPVETPVPTSTGMTWTQEATMVFNTVGTPLRRITAFTGTGASPSAGALGVTFNGQVQTAAKWIIIEVQDLCAAPGWVVQSGSGASDDTGDTSTGLALSAFEKVSHPTFVFLSHTSATATSSVAEPYYTEYTDTNMSDGSFAAYYSPANQTSFANTWSEAGRNGGLILELCSDKPTIAGTAAPAVIKVFK